MKAFEIHQYNNYPYSKVLGRDGGLGEGRPSFKKVSLPPKKEKNMAKYRQSRINEEMFKEAAQIIRTVKDPRVSEAFVSVTGVEVTPDLKYAKIFYSHMQGDKKTVKKGLESSAPYIRGQLAKSLNLRITPELTFVEDTSIAYGAKIEKIISGFTYVEQPEEETTEKDAFDELLDDEDDE